MQLTRRRALQYSTLLCAPMAKAAATKMKIHLTCGSIGIKATQSQAIQYAARYGFDAVEPQAAYLATLNTSEISVLLAGLKAQNLVWGCANLTVDFRKDEATFKKDLAELPAQAIALKRAGVSRVGTYIGPANDTLPYLANLKQHASRLSECAGILGNEGLRLGLEYVAPKTLWSSRKYPFVHCMAEMKDLISAINKPNVGFVLDSWHWYTAGESAADLRTLTNRDIVSVDLNDAPVNVPVDLQVDSKRELPASTGVIDLTSFLNTLNDLGYDGPVRCEPFNSTLRAMTPEQILPVVIDSMKKSFALIR
jgi:sugar phosphate isomerase/epimerase